MTDNQTRILQLVAPVSGDKGEYLVRFDPKPEPHGTLHTTRDEAKATRFKDAGEAHAYWTQQHGIRPDGRPNRPLTAWTVEIRRVEATVNNKAMQRKLARHEAVDVSRCARTVAGDYLLTSFKDGADYCDRKEETWIWSIAAVLKPLPSIMADGTARTLQPGQYLASTGSKFYWAGDDPPQFKCVFLR